MLHKLLSLATALCLVTLTGIPVVADDTAGRQDTVIPVETVDRVTWELLEENVQWDVVRQYLPYMSSNNVERLLNFVEPLYGRDCQLVTADYLGNGERPVSADPLTKGMVDNFTLELMQLTGRWEFVSPWFPHMTPQGVRAVEALSLSKGSSPTANSGTGPVGSPATPNAPARDRTGKHAFDFSALGRLNTLSAAEVVGLALQSIRSTGQFGYVYNMRRYMTVSGIDAAVNAFLGQGGNPLDVSAMLQFMSAAKAQEVAERYFAQRTGGAWDYLFVPYR